MTVGWTEGREPVARPLGVADKLRAGVRAVLIVVLILVCLIVLLLLRLPERAFFAPRRPVTPYLVQFVCRNALRLLRIELVQEGTPMTRAGAVVANHTSWLDILVLNALQPVFFVSKEDVAGWPGIGLLAKVVGTMFVVRNRAYAEAQTKLLTERLKAGHKMLFFPEGTSTDGRRVLPFKTTLFEAFLAPELPEETYIQCVSVVFHAPLGEDPRIYGWWGDMSFGTHLLATLAQRPQGRVEVIYHPPIKVRDFSGRKALAAYCEDQVRRAHQDRLQAFEDQAAAISN